MNTDKLLKTLPHLQQQIDALLEFDCTSQVNKVDAVQCTVYIVQYTVQQQMNAILEFDCTSQVNKVDAVQCTVYIVQYNSKWMLY